MKILKIFAFLLLLVLIILAAGLAYLKLALPDVGDAPSLTIEATPERIQRGAYLANHVAACIDCHSARDWSAFSGPIIAGSQGRGGEAFDQQLGFPGAYYASNITPAGIGDWSDGEVLRAISAGVGKDGRALFPIMGYPNYGKLSEEDLYAIIAYLRTLPAIEHQVPESSSDFPMNFIINTIPAKAEFGTLPARSDEVAYGRYLTTAANCIECHSQAERGQKVAGMEFAGGFEFPLPTGGIVRSTNITPDEDSGIGKWTRAMFIAKFKSYADSAYRPPPVVPGEFNTFMPWTMYAGMTEEDLGAIFAYLQSLPPVPNEVVVFSPAH